MKSTTMLIIVLMGLHGMAKSSEASPRTRQKYIVHETKTPVSGNFGPNQEF